MTSTNFAKTVRLYLPQAEKLPVDVQNLFLNLAINGSSENDYSELEKLVTNLKISKFLFCNLLGTFIEILKLFQSLRARDFQELLREFGASSQFAEIFLKRKQNLEPIVLQPSQHTNVCNIQWKIDLSLLESKLGPASIIVHLSIQLTGNKRIIFRMDQKKFHLLRYNIALLAKRFLKLQQSNNVLKNK